MPFRNFVTPHCHSAASLDTASRAEAFCQWEAEHETGAVTVTDHGTLGGVRKVYDICAKKYKGVLHCIPGLEAYFRDDDCPILLGAGVQKSPAGKLDEYQKYFHLTLHFLDQEAYETCARILTRADLAAEWHGSERKPVFRWADLEELGGKNVTFGSSCLIGVVQRHLAFARRPDVAEQYYRRIRSVAKPGNFYVEVFPHVCSRNWEAAIFVEYEGGERERFPTWKKLRTSKDRDAKGVKAEWLARSWKSGEAATLLAVMQDRKWAERPPRTIASVQYSEGFLQNECTAFAPDGDLQAPCNRWVLEMAARCGDPVLVSDDSHFVSPDDKIVQDIKLQGGGWRFATSYHRMASEEAWTYFRDVLGTPQRDFERWVDDSLAWADRFKGLKFASRRSLPTSFYPRETLDHCLKLVERQGRMDWGNAAWVDRLKREVDLLHCNGTIDLLPYFFIDEEVCRLYECMGELTGPGRGSAAGVLLTYLLGITHVEPLRHGLSLERFITPDRIESGKMPDIDQDLPHRDLLVTDDDLVEGEPAKEPAEGEEGAPEAPRPAHGWLAERFGPCVARVSTDVTLKLRASVLDVMRYLSPDHAVPKGVAQLTHKFLNAPQGVPDRDFVFGYKDGDAWVTGSIEYDENLIAFTRAYPKEWEVVQRCLGIAKTRGQHACAFAISDEPIGNFIPLTSVNGVKVTQLTAEQVEACGALKMDFLVLNSLKDISHALKLVQRRHGGGELDWAAPTAFARRFESDPEFRRAAMTGDEVPPSIKIGGKRVPLIRILPHRGGLHDIYDLPEDQAVFRDICEGDTESVFQFCTEGARDWLRHFNRVKATDPDGTVRKALDSIRALADFTALDRPGPLDYFVTGPDGKHNMLVEYARRARGEAPVGSFPILDALFPETHGVLIYQEQVQRAFREIGGTTALQANDFRIHVGKKQPLEIIKDREIFMPGAVQRVGQEAATQLFESLRTFGSYGFNSSHAICYVTISYACVYLKHHFPLEWWTAVLRNAKKKDVEDKFWRHCGHLVDVPDVNLSGDGFEIVGDRVRAPLKLLQGIGEKAHLELCALRPIASLEDFFSKVERRRVAEAKVVEVAEDGGAEGAKKTRMVKARSALTSRTIETLILAGAMDGLFRPGADVLEKLQEYIVAEAKATGAVSKKTGAPKRKVPERYVGLTAVQRFQLRKRVLPQARDDAFDLARPLLGGADPATSRGRLSSSPVTLGDGSTFEQWSYSGWGRAECYGVVRAAGVRHFGAMPVMRGNTLRVAVAGYVLKYERRSWDDQGRRREMASIILDVESDRFEFVSWSDKRTGKLPEHLQRDLTGAVVLALLSRWSSERPFAVDDLVVLGEPLKESKDDE